MSSYHAESGTYDIAYDDGDKEKNGGEEHKEGAGVDEETAAAVAAYRATYGVC